MIAFYASQPHYVDHLAPIWYLLPDDLKGGFYATGPANTRAKSMNIDALQGVPPRTVRALVAGHVDEKKLTGNNQIAFLEHGTGQFYNGVDMSARHDRERPAVELYLATNRMVADRMADVFPNAYVSVVGCPKLDLYARKVPTGNRVALGWHWSPNSPPEARSAFPYYEASLGDWKQKLDEMGLELFGHGHPRMLNHYHRKYQQVGIPTMGTFHQVLDLCRVYVCDNSSTMFEAAAVGLKVVVLNSPDYRRDVNHGLRFWDYADVGPQVDHPSELPEAVDLVMAEDKVSWELMRARVRRDLYPNFGSATKVAVEALTEWADV